MLKLVSLVLISVLAALTQPGSEPKPDLELVQKAAEGSPDAQYELAAFYIQEGIMESGGIVNPGLFWLQQAAGNGHPHAANEVGHCFLAGRCGEAFDAGEAARWFRAAAESGDVLGAYNLGLLLADGLGVARDEVEATRLLTLAADEGLNNAAFNVAFRYGQGLGAPRDISRKEHYLRQVASDNYGPAAYLLEDRSFAKVEGAFVMAGLLDRLEVGPDQMADFLMEVARALEVAGVNDDDELFVRPREDLSFVVAAEYRPLLIFNLTRIAASLGSTPAQPAMASFYKDGHVVQRSLEEAYYWRKRAVR